MTKKEIQKRVLQNGKPLALSKFSWDAHTSTFSSFANGLVIDFEDITSATIRAGSHCIITTGRNCTIDARSSCIINTGRYCTISIGVCCIVNPSRRCVISSLGSVIFNGTYDELKTCIALDTNRGEKITDIKQGLYWNGMYQEGNFKFMDNFVMEVFSTKELGDYTIYSCRYFEYCGKQKVKVVEKEVNGVKYYAHCQDIKTGIRGIEFKIKQQTDNLEQYAADIKARKNKINMFDFRLITGACEEGCKKWMDENNLPHDIEIDIHEFIKTYSDKLNYGLETFKKFYEEYFE